MKKSVIFLIIVIIILIVGILILNKTSIEDTKDYLKGILETSKPQNISIFMLLAVPILTIISPENITYLTETILLNYSVKNTNSIWYNLDNTNNITITSPLYFSAAEGSHVLYLYANNSQGVSIKSVTFSIKIETTPPSGGSEGGGGTGGAGEAEPLKENITAAEISPNITKPEMPKNITIPPETPSNITEETPKTTKTIIKFLINLLLLVLLIIFIIILTIIIKRKEKSKKRKTKEKES